MPDNNAKPSLLAPDDPIATILFVDDEPSIVRIAAWVLGRLGFRVVTAATPELALGHLATEHFDLLVTDMYMPGQNGIEFGTEAARRHPGLRMLLCTGLADAETRGRAAEVGFQGIVQKPFAHDEFANAVRSALAADAAEA